MEKRTRLNFSSEKYGLGLHRFPPRIGTIFHYIIYIIKKKVPVQSFHFDYSTLFHSNYLFLALAIKQPEISKIWKHQIVEIIRPICRGKSNQDPFSQWKLYAGILCYSNFYMYVHNAYTSRKSYSICTLKISCINKTNNNV